MRRILKLYSPENEYSLFVTILIYVLFSIIIPAIFASGYGIYEFVKNEGLAFMVAFSKFYTGFWSFLIGFLALVFQINIELLKKLKITQARLLSNYKNEFELGLFSPGSVIKIEKDGILISTGNKGIIRLLRMLPAGAKELSAMQFVNGYKIKVGDILSN